jgi:hypothetical protein
MAAATDTADPNASIDISPEQILSDSEINIGLERNVPAPEFQPAEQAAHRQLTWEELHELVWSMPMTRAARQVGITDNGLRKWCNRVQVPLPPQGYWQVPPERCAAFRKAREPLP